MYLDTQIGLTVLAHMFRQENLPNIHGLGFPRQLFVVRVAVEVGELCGGAVGRE